MEYQNVHTGIFKERPNRFIAMVDMGGRVEKCHVKNTGRLRELLLPGVKVYLEKSGNPQRKTAYDLVGVEKNGSYINMDSQAPNKVAGEWLRAQGWEHIKPESRFGNSRLDFYMEKPAFPEGDTWYGEGERTGGDASAHSHSAKTIRAFMEVKGVTLEVDGIARFPDAPTERGIRHMEELIKARREGYEAYILFVIQMKGIRWLEPNDATHPAFGETLRRAAGSGVEILAYDCLAKPGSLTMDRPVPVRL